MLKQVWHSKNKAAHLSSKRYVLELGPVNVGHTELWIRKGRAS